MSLNKMKKLAIKYIAEDKRLKKESKKFLMRYIKEDASSSEVRKYLMDYIYSCLKENDIKQNYNQNTFKKLTEFVRIGTAQIRDTLGQDDVDDLKEDYENCKETDCGNLGGRRYDLCKAKCKLQSLRQNRELLEDAAIECDNLAKYPDSCKEKINEKLDKLDGEINKTEEKIRSLEGLV